MVGLRARRGRVTTYVYRRVVSRHWLRYTAERKARRLEACEPNTSVAYDIEHAGSWSRRWLVIRYSHAGNGS
jgi:hypothetical protein